MKPINARTRTGRVADGRGATHRRRVGRIEEAYGVFIDGANALQIGYGDQATAGGTSAGTAGGTSAGTAGGTGAGTAANTGATVPGPRVGESTRSGRSAQPVSPRQRTVTRAVPVAAPVPVAVPRAPFLIGVVAAVVVGVLGVLLLNTKINENSFRLDNLQAKQATLDLEEQQLAQALAERESPGNLRAAATRLGLVPAGTPAFLRLPDGQVTGVPQPAGRGGDASSGR